MIKLAKTELPFKMRFGGWKVLNCRQKHDGRLERGMNSHQEQQHEHQNDSGDGKWTTKMLVETRPEVENPEYQAKGRQSVQ